MSNRNLQPYKPVDVSFLGEQKLDDVSSWRNNLVAASRRHNYLFIAVRSTIRVYAPKYPYQIIPTTTPYTTLTSAASPNAAGSIDPRDPHAINSLTVGELGFEEVLVSAHDDGDVCAWYTRDLQRVAFRLSVGKSAWGVALHKERRLLAVSANTHQISVFELAIGPEGEKEDETELEGEEGLILGDEDCGRSHNGGRKRRRRRRVESRSPYDSDVSEDDGSICAGCKRRRRKKSPVKDKTVKTLIGHDHNIPNISFLSEPSGRWLVGTSIDGAVILWDVVTERTVEKCKMGPDSAGWSVLFLKPQAFKPVSSIYEALGKPVPSQTNPELRKKTIRDICTFPTDYYDPPTILRSYEAHVWDISPLSFQNQRNSRALLTLDEHSDDDDDDDSYWGGEADEESQQSSEDVNDHEVEVFIVPGGQVELLTEEGNETDTSVSTTATGSQGEMATTFHSVPASVIGAADVGSGPEEDGEQRNDILDTIGPVRVVELVQDSEGEGDKACEAGGAHDNGKRRKGHNGYRDDEYEDVDEDEVEERPAQPPISFIFSTTEYNCHLLTLTPSLTPNVICRSPLFQRFPRPAIQYLNDIDRLNMVHCIPDLSLVIAASQKGRAAIFRLTRVGDVFGMRLDTVLPREDKDSERGRERRPSVALLGVAVSPVQERRRGRGGGLGVWGRRRWRLMMVYMDGSVNSYELGREEGIVEVGGIGGGLGGLGGFVMV